MIAKVKCLVCDNEFSRITNTHLKLHNLSVNDYISKFNVESSLELCTDDLRKKFGHVPWNKGLKADRYLTRTCLFCGNEFKTKRKSKKFCDLRCYGLSIKGRIPSLSNRTSPTRSESISKAKKGISNIGTSKGLKEYFANPNNREKVSEKQKQLHEEYPERFDSFKTAIKVRWEDPSQHERARAKNLTRWLDAEYKNKVVRKWRKSCGVHPNKKELLMDEMLQSNFPGEWRFVGDGEFILAGKNPDFMNINGQKKLIELYGDYWHRNDDPQDRIDFFKQYGYDTLVIWEKEINHREDTINCIRQFTEVKL